MGPKGPASFDPFTLMLKMGVIKVVSVTQSTLVQFQEMGKDFDQGLRSGSYKAVVQHRYPLSKSKDAQVDLFTQSHKGKIIICPWEKN